MKARNRSQMPQDDLGALWTLVIALLRTAHGFKRFLNGVWFISTPSNSIIYGRR